VLILILLLPVPLLILLLLVPLLILVLLLVLLLLVLPIIVSNNISRSAISKSKSGYYTSFLNTRFFTPISILLITKSKLSIYT